MHDETNDRTEMLEKRLEALENILSKINKRLELGDFDERPCETNLDTISETCRKKIDSIMRNFDFSKVCSIMRNLDWKWACSHTELGVPSVDELKSQAKHLLTEACVEKTCISTGGFRAVYEEGAPDDDPYIGLEFIVEECEGFADDDEDDEDDDEVTTKWG